MRSVYKPENVVRLGKDFIWPGDKKVAVVIDVAYECWSDGSYSGIGPMGNVLKPGFVDNNAISWGRYGVLQGIHRILRILKRHNAKASFMTNGVIAELYPADVRKVFEQGHDIYGHSYAMDVIPTYLDESAEIANIKRTTDLIVNACGYTPKGWISPRLTGSTKTSELLIENGYKWHSDCMDDDLPYLEKYPNGDIMAIPFTMEINDMPHSVRYGNSPGELVHDFLRTIDWMTQFEPNSTLMNFTAHTHVYGRPAGALVFDQLIELASNRSDIWLTTREQVYEYVKKYF